MVMGPTHALHGATAGLAVSLAAPAFTLPMSPPTAIVLGMLGAGAAVAPDLDHPNSTASRSLGPISWAASWLIRALSAAVYERTKTRRDRPNRDGHRGITHTGPGALGLGVLFGGSCALAAAFSPTAGMWTVLAVLWLFLVWALRGLPPKRRHSQDYLVATVLTGFAYLILTEHYAGSMPLLIGVVVAVGAYTHALGDSLTDYGAPLLWPATWNGERWYSCGPPAPLRFKAGKPVEMLFVFPLSILIAAAATLAVFPGGWPALLRVVGIA